MNNHELSRIINQDPVLQPLFSGIFFFDKVPQLLKSPSFIIVNTAKSKDKTGRHWFLVTNFFGYSVFDPLGAKCHWIRKLPYSIEDFNKRAVQSSLSNLCGAFCIYGAKCLFENQDRSLENILETSFNLENLEQNDFIVQNYLKDGEYFETWALGTSRR